MIEVELSNFAHNLDYYLNSGEQDFITHNRHDYVVLGENGLESIDVDFCNQNGIAIIDVKHRGGSVLLTKSAMGYAKMSNDLDNRFSDGLQNAVVDFLKNKGLNATRTDNDILVDGIYKVASAGKKPLNDKTYFTMQFSFENDAELIDKIFKKPMVKIPKGLNDYGITKQEIKEMLINYIEENQ